MIPIDDFDRYTSWLSRRESATPDAAGTAGIGFFTSVNNSQINGTNVTITILGRLARALQPVSTTNILAC